MMGMGGFGMMLVMALFWLLIVGLAIWLISSLFPRTPEDPGYAIRDDTTGTVVVREILRQRYARGEISQAEFERLRRELDQGV